MNKTHALMESALREVALRNRTGIEEVKKEIRLAGLCNADPAIQKAWTQIPSGGEIPTPEELIDYAVQRILNRKDGIA